ncbi:ATP-binding cassette domain-containing protein [Marinivivus vitaminiproducens]|uniref:ATP-binding cassette domain-containing protein n=1 Tax=Marinivivus vitaminiproducens TaxID=3035935 RepID=UPI0027A606D5|nr:ATP-binding cassette domain-containing protein [Geminicoccaceae bacterium SCSIO 64248]
MTAGADALLEAEGLVRSFGGGRTWWGAARPVTRAVDDVALSVAAGETLGVVGESGSGKSTLARMLTGLLVPDAGTIRLAGKPVAGPGRADRATFHRTVQLVFQDPQSSLNPRKTVQAIIEAPLQALMALGGSARRERAGELAGLVGLGPEFLQRYPHELSGGQCQRVGIARAIGVEPKLLVLDEPVSALDVSIQAQVLRLLRDLQQRLGLAYVFISHDLAVIEAMSDRVMVMQQGKVVESGTRDALFASPRHAYTKALLDAVPGQKARAA